MNRDCATACPVCRPYSSMRTHRSARRVHVSFPPGRGVLKMSIAEIFESCVSGAAQEGNRTLSNRRSRHGWPDCPGKGKTGPGVEGCPEHKGVPHYSVIEQEAHETGLRLSRLIQQQRAKDVAAEAGSQAPCPECNRRPNRRMRAACGTVRPPTPPAVPCCRRTPRPPPRPSGPASTGTGCSWAFRVRTSRAGPA